MRFTFSKLTFLVFLIASYSVFSIGQSVELKPALPGGFEIVENWIHDGGRSGKANRFLFIYGPERSFDPNTLALIFDTLQRSYCDPYTLRINIYTDKTMLEKRISSEKSPSMIDYNDTPEGRRAAKDAYEKTYGSKELYFMAEYFRYGSYEFYDYTSNKDSRATTRVILREPDKGSGKPPLTNVCKSSQ